MVKPVGHHLHGRSLLFRDEGWEELTFYADGTCARPTVPVARQGCHEEASTGTQERNTASEQWKQHGVLPPCFIVFAQGLVSCRQTIAQAGLTIVIRIFTEFALGLGVQGLLRSANLDLA